MRLKFLQPDDHHFYWYRDLYAAYRFNGSQHPAQFRGLTTNRGMLPRQFHDVLHDYTKPPVRPAVRYMEHYLRSYEIAKQLFQHAELALRLEGLAPDLLPLSDEALFGNSVESYEDVFSKYRSNVTKAVGTHALIDIGLSEDFDPDSPAEVLSIFQGVSFSTIPDYTTEYFCKAA